MFASLHTSTFAIGRVESRGKVSRLAAALRQGLAARHQRQQLASLDDARLADLGLTRTEAMAEASRPMWDVPRGWRA